MWGLVGVLACMPLLFHWLDIRGWTRLLLVASLLGGLAHWEWYDLRNVSVLPEITGRSHQELDGYVAKLEGTIASAVRVDGDRPILSFYFLQYIQNQTRYLAPKKGQIRSNSRCMT
ncbi:hypothetical protein AB9M62_47425 [Bacillales bacterium AN1005]